MASCRDLLEPVAHVPRGPKSAANRASQRRLTSAKELSNLLASESGQKCGRPMAEVSTGPGIASK